MLRFRDIKNASAASSYYGRTDGGYYLDASDLHREVGGEGAKLLGLSSQPDFEQFKRLLQGLDPRTGEQLTSKLIDGRIAGWDVTASIPKGVTVALERGDERIHGALWEAGRETMTDLEKLITTRVRKDGKQDDRVTGNMIWYGFEHPETRPAKQDGMPDPDRHIHFVIPNATFDAIEGEWKAIKFRPVMDLRKWFDRRFDMRLAGKLTDLGYQIETKYKADGSGGKRYFSWDVDGIPQSVVTKFSRRTGEVEKLAEQLGIESPTAKDKLGATSRQHKREDMTLADYRDYWDKRITPEESRQIEGTIGRAREGGNSAPENTVDKGVAFAVQHHFERRSVVNWRDVAITAMEHCMGGARPEEIEPEARRQGVLFKNGEVTTRDVLAAEGRIIGFAREGRGECRPFRAAGTAEGVSLAHLSADQQAVVRHIWHSADRVVMVEGDAGTGKTDAMKVTIPGIDRPGVFLAPSASASRGVLREKGFSNADTIARFLIDERFREQARGGYIYIDEAPLAGLADIDSVFRHARDLGARVILQGDRKQHKSVQRGNLFEILDNYAGVPVGRLTKNWRQQTDEYKQAVDAIAKGKILDGYDKLVALGSIQQTPVFDHNKPLVDDYLAALAANKSVLVVAPTHKEGGEITEEIRKRLKEEGKLDSHERTFERLVSLGWTEAERGDRTRYGGDEAIRLVRNSGPFRAGQRLSAAELLAADRLPSGAHFAVYERGSIALAAGDAIRITAGGKSKDGHRLDNGNQYTVKGFTRDGDIALSNGWVIDKHFGHLSHAYTTTSFGSQGRTVDRVLIAMGNESRAAVNAEQFYVSVSRGRESARIYTNMSPVTFRDAIKRSDPRKSATELMTDTPVAAQTPVGERMQKDRLKHLVKRMQSRYRILRDRAADGNRDIAKIRDREPGIRHAR